MADSILRPIAGKLVAGSDCRVEIGTKSSRYMVRGLWWQRIERHVVRPVEGILYPPLKPPYGLPAAWLIMIARSLSTTARLTSTTSP